MRKSPLNRTLVGHATNTTVALLTLPIISCPLSLQKSLSYLTSPTSFIECIITSLHVMPVTNPGVTCLTDIKPVSVTDIAFHYCLFYSVHSTPLLQESTSRPCRMSSCVCDMTWIQFKAVICLE